MLLIKREKIRLVGENRKNWYCSRLHSKHVSPQTIFLLLLFYYFNKPKDIVHQISLDRRYSFIKLILKMYKKI